MCGISGIVSRQNAASVQSVRLMNDKIHYRGPDETGVWGNGTVALGHNRLSIIDLSSGKQPMEDSGGRFVIVYNGELYNYKEVRRNLEKSGMSFRTDSDTEVVLNAYARYGKKSLDLFEGMYAYTIYDKDKGIVFSARDRLGKKPFYYFFNNNEFIFSSELSAIRNSGLVEDRIDYNALGFYLTLGYVPSPFSMIEDVKKLPHSYWLELNIEKWKLEIGRYWDTLEEQDNSMPDADKVETARKLLDEAVRKRLVSDVPLGAFLSGGLDSSGIVALMSRYQDNPKTFSVSFAGSEHDEAVYAGKVADYFKTEHTELKIDYRDTDNLKKILTSSGEPFGDPTLIPTYYMSHVAKKHVTVCLSGDGADEVFGGYPKFFKKFRVIDLPWLRRLFELTPPFKGKYRILKRALSVDSAYYESLCRYTLHKGEYNSLNYLLKPDIYNKVASQCNLHDYLSDYQKGKKYDLLSSRYYLDLHTYMVDNCLVKVDRGSMLASLEVRNPYLDHELVKYAYSIPGRYLADANNYKAFLKEVLTGIVPDFVIHREKKGFNVPIPECMRTYWKGLIEEVLFEDTVFDIEYLKKIWDLHISKKRDYMYEIWLPFVYNLNFIK